MKRVLVVEDERNIRILLTSILRQQGFDVVEAPDGREALRLLREDGQYRLIITDLRMPNMNGVALLEALHEDFPDIPVIVTSAYATADWASPAVDNAYRSLSKPFSHRQLLDAVQDVLVQPG